MKKAHGAYAMGFESGICNEMLTAGTVPNC